MTEPIRTPSLLVVDDEPDLRSLYELTLLRAGYRVDTVPDLQTARQVLAEQRFDVVITDMRLPDGLGLELISGMAREGRTEKFIVITAYGSAENAVEALKLGAFDYLTKPVDLKQFRTVVATALDSQNKSVLPGRPAGAPTNDLGATQALTRIVGHSDVMVAVKQRIERVARSMAPVLVLGESGTGKELVARALHACSHRAQGPFIAVNCGAIPESLIESEFFGVRKGAFTGASQDRDGYFQAARGGTLFLDEIGDLPLPMQVKLLRAIQERQVRPLGSTQEEHIDVRFVSATHKDLVKAVHSQQFRQDLFYRLNVIELRIPPLRERPADIPALAQALLLRLCQESGQAPLTLSDDAQAWLQRQAMPGNVRELENILHRGLALSSGPVLELEDLSEPHSHLGMLMDLATADAPPASATPPTAPASPTPASPAAAPSMAEWMDRTEREVLLETLRAQGQNLAAAAEQLSLTVRQLSFRLKRLGLAVPEHPHAPAG